MAEVSRQDTSTDRHPEDRPPVEGLPGGDAALPELTQSASPASNPALNRSAEAVGRGVGTAVAGVRRLPQQFDRLRSHIHLVQKGQAGETLLESATDVAGEWRDAAESSMAEAAQTAERYRHEAAERINRSLEQLGRTARIRLYAFRVQARRGLAEARKWEYERPLRVIGVCAGVAFVLGVALRVWRSNRDY
jgi:ElaB/YqjD/DUF883 family membrane-anchored ribosome-binding protein